MKNHAIIIWCLAVTLTCTLAAASVTIVSEGQARAIVVLADKPTPVAEYAARELVSHIALSTGVELPVVRESQQPQLDHARVFVGMTREAADRGIDGNKLTYDTFRIKTDKHDIFLLGAEDPDVLPLSRDHGYSGTMFAVYELLDEELGIRWLWPGPLGTFAPTLETVTIREQDSIKSPRLMIREISNPGERLCAFANGREKKAPDYPEHYRQLAFPTQEQATRYTMDYEIFMRRHRMGRSQPLHEERESMAQRKLNMQRMESVYRLPRPLHAFHGWWRRFGETHPDWFAMREDGTRTPQPSDPYQGNAAAMCVSNPDLHRFLAENVVREGKVFKVGPRTVWDGKAILDLSEADLAYERLCQCPDCRAWDGDQTPSPMEFVNKKNRGGMLSDRYARFWKTVYDLTSKQFEDIKIPVYIYHNYFQAPQRDIWLGPNIIGEFVLYGVAGNFPMTPEEFQWNKEQWAGWKRTGVTLLLRPNYLLYGYEMPEITTRQIVSFINFISANGGKAICYEGKGGFPWAAQGPMSYLHFRLMWKPDMSYDAIADEYYAAFGAAASDIREYYEYWEKYVRERPPLHTMVPQKMNLQLEPGVLDHISRPVAAVIGYPPSAYLAAEAILERAQTAVQEETNPDYALRVAFIRAGLEHVRLSAAIHEFLDYGTSVQGAAPQDPAALQKARSAMGELINFRRSHSEQYVSDYLAAARIELGILNAPLLFPEHEGTMERELAFRALWPLPEVGHAEDSTTVPAKRIELPKEGWKFMEDPRREGHLSDWHSEEYDDSAWLDARIGVPWGHFLDSNLIGIGWYRRTFVLPNAPEGARVHMFFEGVDETCWVWVNGQLVGGQNIGPSGWDKPFQLDISGAVTPGENLVAVRVENVAYAGGIWSPVSLEIISADD